jgi:hypothetical protein
MFRALELLTGLPDAAADTSVAPPAAPAEGSTAATTRVIAAGLRVAACAYTFTETREEDSDALLLARAYFDAKEYQRAAHVLDVAYVGDPLLATSTTGQATTSSEAGPAAAMLAPQTAAAGNRARVAVYPSKPYFLRCYALYLVCGGTGCGQVQGAAHAAPHGARGRGVP